MERRRIHPISQLRLLNAGVASEAESSRRRLVVSLAAIPCRLESASRSCVVCSVRCPQRIRSGVVTDRRRLARWLAELMSLQAGFPIPDYGFTGHGSSKRQEVYLAAVTRGYAQDYAALTNFFAEAVRRRLATLK